MVKRKYHNLVVDDRLPDELTTEILHHLPTKESVLESKSIFKGWKTGLAEKRIGLLFGLTPRMGEENITRLFYRDQITEEDLNKMLLENNHDPDEGTYKLASHPIVGSCNGLVCFYVSHHHIQDPIYIMNPTTGEHLHLPRIAYPKPDPVTTWYPRNVIGGFGYCEHTGEYKVVRIHLNGKVEVHTLGDTRGWRNIRVIPYTFCDSGVHAHGFIFWIHQSEGNVHIVSFDLETETFLPHSPPPQQIPGRESPVDSRPSLGMVLFGVQLLFYYKHEEVEYRIDFWEPISNENNQVWEHGGKWKWNHKMSIVLEGRKELLWPTYSPIALGENDDILLWNHHHLTRYNRLTRTLIEIWGTPWRTKVAVIPHMRSDLSLKNFGGESETCTHDDHASNTFLRLSM